MAGVTKEEIARAKELDLLTYFKLVEPSNLKLVGKEYRHKVHSSLTISKDSLWCWHCIGLRGRTALKYLIDVEKVPYVEAVREINRIQGGVVHSSQPVSLPRPRAKPEAPRDFKLPKPDANSYAAMAYLRGRCILNLRRRYPAMAAKNKFLNAMKMPSIDDMFSSEADRQRESGDLVTEVPLSELHPFVGHPFEVRDDEDMQKLVDSIRENGVLTNLTVRRRAEGGYEIISGHRRFHAAQRAGLDSVKVQVRDIDDDQAIISMVDANIQREHISPMEKARAYRMKYDALKRQGCRTDGGREKAGVHPGGGDLIHPPQKSEVYRRIH